MSRQDRCSCFMAVGLPSHSKAVCLQIPLIRNQVTIPLDQCWSLSNEVRTKETGLQWGVKCRLKTNASLCKCCCLVKQLVK